MGRIEHGITPGYIDYFIEQSMLKACCANMSFGYSDFKRQLGEQFRVTEVSKKDMTAKTRGPQMRVAVLRISRLITEKDHELLNSVPVEQD
jgi:arsenate reductase-like glutaredoxin family protein